MDNFRMTRNLLVFFAGAVLVAGSAWLAIFFVVGNGNNNLRETMWLDLSKSLGQLLLVTIIGGGITFMYTMYAKQREFDRNKLEEDNQLRRELLNALIEVRANVEKTRREYRVNPVQNRKEAYGYAVKNLLQARLDLSKVWHDTVTWKELYQQDTDVIQCRLNGMKQYLDNLVNEYEAQMEIIQSAKNGNAERLIATLPCFGAFTSNNGGEDYTEEFLKRDYREAARIIRYHIIHP
jgi:cysteinyl-tRNA synthetase